MNQDSAAAFSVSLGAYLAAHQVGDYWIQTSAQALGKGEPGWEGRRACLGHVATYTATQGAFLGAALAVTGLRVSPWRAAAGLAVSAATHYFADRRKPLREVAERTGKAGFWDSGEGLASGAAHMDQAWHWGFIFTSALVTAS
jgi:hypothetical protein